MTGALLVLGSWLAVSVLAGLLLGAVVRRADTRPVLAASRLPRAVPTALTAPCAPAAPARTAPPVRRSAPAGELVRQDR